jgi:hypothetical protein
MNPTKRKKLYRLELHKAKLQSNNLPTKEEKVILKEEQLPIAEIKVEDVQAKTLITSTLEMGLKLPESSIDTKLETIDLKKEKKKKSSSQDI